MIVGLLLTNIFIIINAPITCFGPDMSENTSSLHHNFLNPKVTFSKCIVSAVV